MEEAAARRLLDGARGFGVSLPDGVISKLDQYLSLLQEWNRQINLTSVVADADVVERHFLDCIAVHPHVAGARTLVDIGSGPGFPGQVLALLNPELAVTCVESIHKKIAFLRAVNRALGLSAHCLPIRLENLDQTFDVAISRATFDPPEWVRLGARLVNPGGRLIAMLGAERPVLEVPPGFVAEPVHSFQISGADRAIAVFRRMA